MISGLQSAGRVADPLARKKGYLPIGGRVGFSTVFGNSRAVTGDKRHFVPLLSPSQSGEIACGALSPHSKTRGTLPSAGECAKIKRKAR